MMKYLLAGMLLLAGPAFANQQFNPSGSFGQQYDVLADPATGALCSSSAPCSILSNGGGSGGTGTPTETTGTCGTSSSTILAASSATSSESFHLSPTAANPVWLNFTGTAAVQANPSFDLQPGMTITFAVAAGLLPTSAVTCIASASTSVVEIFK